MIITTRQLYSSIGLVVGLLIATALFFTLPTQAQDMPVALMTLHTSSANEAETDLSSQQGYATWYNLNQHGRRTASGERYDHTALTAAHPDFAFDSMVRVTNTFNDQSIVVRINDRLDTDVDAIIGLSGAAARELGLFDGGPSEVMLTMLAEGSDSMMMTEDDDSSADTDGANEIHPLGSDDAPALHDQPTVPAPPAIDTHSPEQGSGLYTLQIGSFGSRSHAESLAAVYPEAWIKEVATENGSVYRVYFNRFAEEAPARTAQNRLWAEGQDSFFRTLEP